MKYETDAIDYFIWIRHRLAEALKRARQRSLQKDEEQQPRQQKEKKKEEETKLKQWTFG